MVKESKARGLGLVRTRLAWSHLGLQTTCGWSLSCKEVSTEIPGSVSGAGGRIIAVIHMTQGINQVQIREGDERLLARI